MPKKEKIILEIMSGNMSGVMEGILSVDTAEVERIEPKKDVVCLSFPGVNISVPRSFCDTIRKKIEETEKKS
jgi:hypothetical protein